VQVAVLGDRAGQDREVDLAVVADRETRRTARAWRLPASSIAPRVGTAATAATAPWTSGGTATATSPPAPGCLARRSDVDPQRIGVVDMSLGGEEAAGGSATLRPDPGARCRGATARRAADGAWVSNKYGLRGLPQEQLEHAQDWGDRRTHQRLDPPSNRAAVEASGATRYLLITAGDAPDVDMPPPMSPSERRTE
jgi:hypothetical protein